MTINTPEELQENFCRWREIQRVFGFDLDGNDTTPETLLNESKILEADRVEYYRRQRRERLAIVIRDSAMWDEYLIAAAYPEIEMENLIDRIEEIFTNP